MRGGRRRRAVLRRARRGRLPRDDRRPPAARLGAVVGAADLRARRPGDGRGGARGGARRDELRRADRARGRARRRDRRRGAVGRAGAARLVRAPRPRCRRSGSRAAFTHRDRVLKFAGGYHGHADPFLAEAGSGLATLGIPASPGVPTGVVADTIVVAYNDVDGAAAAVERYGEGLAAIFVEPVAGNMGCVPPAPGFLEALRAALRRVRRAARLRRGDHRLPRRARRRAGALRRHARPDRSSARSSAAACRSRRSAAAPT